MIAKLNIVDGTAEEVADLVGWLRSDDRLRGHVHTVRRPISDTSLGGTTDILTVVLGTGGAGTALVSALKTWLTSRRSKVKVTIRNADRSLTVELETLGRLTPELQRILKADGHET